MSDDIVLGTFELHVRAPYPTIINMGKRNSGKSTAMIAQAAMLNKYQVCVWSGNKETQDEWAERLESRATVYGVDANSVARCKEIINYNQKKLRYYKVHKKQKLPDRYGKLFIFDDVTGTKAFRRAEFMEDLFANGRHYAIAIIIATQHVNHLPPSVRMNADYIFIFHLNKKQLENIHKELIEEPYDVGAFIQMVHMVTGKKKENNESCHFSLVFQNVTKADSLSEQFSIFWPGPKESLEKVKLGAQEWREWNKANWIDHEILDVVKQERRKKQQQRLQKYYEHKQRRQGLGELGIDHMDMDYIREGELSDGYYNDEDGNEVEGLDPRIYDTNNINTRKTNMRVHMPKFVNSAATNDTIDTSQHHKHTITVPNNETLENNRHLYNDRTYNRYHNDNEYNNNSLKKESRYNDRHNDRHNNNNRYDSNTYNRYHNDYNSPKRETKPYNDRYHDLETNPDNNHNHYGHARRYGRQNFLDKWDTIL